MTEKSIAKLREEAARHPEFVQAQEAKKLTIAFQKAAPQEQQKILEEQLADFVAVKHAEQLQKLGVSYREIEDRLRKDLQCQVKAQMIKKWITEGKRPKSISLDIIKSKWVKKEVRLSFDAKMAELVAYHCFDVIRRDKHQYLHATSQDKQLIERIAKVISKKTGRKVTVTPVTDNRFGTTSHHFRISAVDLANYLRQTTENKEKLPLEHLLYNPGNRRAFLKVFFELCGNVERKGNVPFFIVRKQTRGHLLAHLLPLLLQEEIFPRVSTQGKHGSMEIRGHDLKRVLPLLPKEKQRQFFKVQKEAAGFVEKQALDLTGYEAIQEGMSKGHSVNQIASNTKMGRDQVWSYLKGHAPRVVERYAIAHEISRELGHELPAKYPFSLAVGQMLIKGIAAKSRTRERREKLGLLNLKRDEKPESDDDLAVPFGFEKGKPTPVVIPQFDRSIQIRKEIESALAALEPEEREAFEIHTAGGKAEKEALTSAMEKLRKNKILRKLFEE